MGRGSTQEPQLLFIYFFTVATICIFCIRTSVFRRNHVADSIIDFLDYFADVFGLFRQNLVADTFLMTILAMETILKYFYYS